jgi:alkylation response protein AidB-like acyl-CoA dehydrogenase
MALLQEEFGRGLVLEPYLGAIVLCVPIVLAASPQHAARLLPQVADGRQQLALAHLEANSRDGLDQLTTQAIRQGAGYRLAGRKVLVLCGASADHLIVSAGTAGGTALFLVPTDAPGVSCRRYRLIDDTDAADFDFDQVSLPADALLIDAGSCGAVLERALDRARVGLCAELIGGMEAALALTTAYLKQRKQFGKPLAEFQVLQHRTADMFIEVDAARSLLYAALSALDGEADARACAVSACKLRVVEAARTVCGHAVHNHGGMGMTLEYPVGHYLRRALVADKLFGDAAFHLERYRRLTQLG